MIYTKQSLIEELNEHLKNNDQSQFLIAFRDIVDEMGGKEIAGKCGLVHETMYQVFSPSGNPKMSTLMNIMEVCGFKFCLREATLEERTNPTPHKVRARPNSIAINFPGLVSYWHPLKNQPYSPNNLPIKSLKQVNWICQKGHEWQEKPCLIMARLKNELFKMGIYSGETKVNLLLRICEECYEELTRIGIK